MVRGIQIRRFNEEDLKSVYQLVQNTIDISYHGAYPVEAVEFFKNYQSKEQILNDAAAGYTVVAESNNELLGTGTLFGTNLRRVFVNPLYQYRGTGKLIVQELERKASVESSTTLYLEASLVSRQFWESLGFTVEKEGFIPVRNNQKLHYYRMVKIISIIS